MPDEPTKHPVPPPGWRVFAESVRGTIHRHADIPGQDEHRWQVDTLGRLVADGAGSARLGGEAAKIATHAAVESTIRSLEQGSSDIPTLLRQALRAARTALTAESLTLDCPVDDLATTLIILLATPDLCAVAQIGDGFALAVGASGEVIGHSIPQGGEYASDTVFLADPHAVENAAVNIWTAPVAAVAVLSDGLQRLAMQMPQKIPHPPFFASIFENGERDEAEAETRLSGLLNSSRVAEKTGDDLTMVVAWNRRGRG